MINLREIILGNPSRLRFIVRFSNCPRIHNESVSDHSFYVALYSYYIGMDLIFSRGFPLLNLGMILGKALVHDMDECFSGDFIRMFKHSNPELKKQVELACMKLMFNFSEDLTNKEPRFSSILFDDWKHSKNDKEGKIVAFSDYLSVLSYIHQEIDLGNHRMRKQIPELTKFHHYFKSEEFEFLDPYVDEAGQILKEIEESTRGGVNARIGV